jgi:hypothetical protein
MISQIPLTIAYGGGTNSVAMLCGFLDRGIKPDLIIFSDTGGELPRTYDHISMMSEQTKKWWGIGIKVVFTTYKKNKTTLEADCLRNKTLPSLAFGSKSCSVKYKLEPKYKFLKKWMIDRGIETVRSAVGYDIQEGHRSVGIKERTFWKNLKEINYFPLIEWRMRRQDCVGLILKHGLKLPGKSSCFFCPSMKSQEIINLRDNHREFYDRATKLEENMTPKGRVEGLSFGVKWSEIVLADDNQAKLFQWIDENDPKKIPCGCYDG